MENVRYRILLLLLLKIKVNLSERNAAGHCTFYIGADSAGATGNFAPVLTKEPGQTPPFAPVTFGD